MRAGLIRRPLVALAALSFVLLLITAFALSNRAPSADAADSETAALIGYFNQYRASNGVSALSTSSSANADAQAAAQNSVNHCSYLLPQGHNVAWASYGRETAQLLWNAYVGPPPDNILNYIRNPAYNSVGIGRAYGPQCNWGYLWVMVLDTAGGGGTATPTRTPSPTPSRTPSPTPSKTPSPTPGSSLTPTPTVTPTFTPTPTPSPTSTPTPSPTPTPDDCAGATDAGIQCTFTPTAAPTDSPTPTTPPEIPGDADCDGDVDSGDGILVLMLAAHLDSAAPCLGLSGVNCQGLIDVTDVLTLLAYLGDIPVELPFGCPPLGIIVTPTPSPFPTASPTPTATPTATPTPPPTSATPAPSVTPVAEAVHHCLLALVSYQLDTDQLDGEVRCTPTAGTGYDCYFGNVNAVCVASTTAYPDYACSLATGVADCTPYSGAPEYQCFLNAPGSVECLPTQTGYPAYECGISGGTVTCTSDPPFPDFVCTKQTVDFDCVGQSQP